MSSTSGRYCFRNSGLTTSCPVPVIYNPHLCGLTSTMYSREVALRKAFRNIAPFAPAPHSATRLPCRASRPSSSSQCVRHERYSSANPRISSRIESRSPPASPRNPVSRDDTHASRHRYCPLNESETFSTSNPQLENNLASAPEL